MLRFILFTLIVIAVVGGLVVMRQKNPNQTSVPSQNSVAQNSLSTPEVVAENIKVPWEVEFLPGGDLLVTERRGSLVRISQNNRQSISVAGVVETGEGGLLGVTLHPQFSSNSFIYLYFTTRSSNGGLENRVERYRFENNQLLGRGIILSGIPASGNHNGGRLAFGPDGFLYITTGDAGMSALAQDTESLAGKILRVKDDGYIPADNPFNNAVYSYGHRNPQGLAWDNDGRLWATEHGRSGLQSGYDELNLIEKGKNYGWPVVEGPASRNGMVSPVIQSGANDTWAPAGLAYYNRSLYFGGLRGSTLYEANITGFDVSLNRKYVNEYGRIRAVRTGPDGFLYFSTSNTDGRGTFREGDDKLIKVSR